MRPHVTVTTAAPVALKGLLASAMRSEWRMLDLRMERTGPRLRSVEAP
jgi:hypothetical protein